MTGPFRPRLAIRVGVTGHRPNKLAGLDLPALQSTVDAVLAEIRTAAQAMATDRSTGYQDAPPRLCIVSSLAEGADRIVAHRALAQGFELQVALPYAAAAHAAEFTEPGSYQEFEQLIARATAVLVLDGEPRSTVAYEAAGRTVLDHCDLLIALWDGSPATGRGGTGQIVSEATAAGLPVIRIDTRPPHTATPLPTELREALLPRPGGLTLELAAGDPYVEADRRASRYATWYRRAFTWTYALMPVAVLAALRGYFDHAHERLWVAIELAVLLTILALYHLTRRGAWQERWLDYRSLAERLRQQRLLLPFGGSVSAARPPTYQTPRENRVDWYLRAVVRDTGLPQAVMDPSYLAACRATLNARLQEQVDYHGRTAVRLRRRHHQLHRLATACFGGALLASGLHFVPLAIPGAALTQLAALLPAMGGAIHGYLSQGDFQNLARRSEGVRAGLQDLLRRLDATRSTSGPLGDVAQAAVRVMGTELVDWRVGVEEKPPTLPG